VSHYNKRVYSYQDLRWRPVEDVVDQLNCREIAQALGVRRSFAGVYKHDPFLLDDMMVKRLRDWLEVQK
jgi:hypothetical protein